jgi:hypothetical protein
MQRFSRRRFLKKSSALTAGAMALGLDRNLFWSGPDLKFPSQPRKRLSVASWPFRAFIDSPTNYARDRKQPGMDLKDFAAMVVKRFQVANIEPFSDHFRSTDSAYLHEFRDAVEKAGHVLLTSQ